MATREPRRDIPCFIRKTGDREIELIGLALFISDQTLTPLHVRLQLSLDFDCVSWIDLKLGERIDGECRRDPYGSAKVSGAMLHVTNRLDSVDWLPCWLRRISIVVQRSCNMVFKPTFSTPSNFVNAGSPRYNLSWFLRKSTLASQAIDERTGLKNLTLSRNLCFKTIGQITPKLAFGSLVDRIDAQMVMPMPNMGAKK